MLGPFPDSYVGRTASDDTFGGLVPYLERSTFVGHHHAFGHVVQHGLKKTCFQPQFFFQPLAFDGILQGACQERGSRLSFHEIVLGACLDELDSQFLILQSGHQHDRNSLRRRVHPDQGLCPLAVRQREIQQNDVERGLSQASDGGIEPVDVREGEPAGAGFRQEFLQKTSIAGIVFNQQDMGRTGAHLVPFWGGTGNTTIPSQKSSMDRTTRMN